MSIESDQIMYRFPELHDAEGAEQISIMRQWFHDHFVNPVDSLPYESAKGGYFYLWGGPYEPYDQLSDTFDGIVPEVLIKELADELEDESLEWSARPSAEEDEYYLYMAEEAVYFDHDLFQHLEKNLNLLTAMTKMPFDAQVLISLYRMLFVHIIASMEAFLSDIFTRTVLTNDCALRNFVESNPEYKKTNIVLSSLFDRIDGIRNFVKQDLGNVIWHTLPKIRRMFESVFSTNFSCDIGFLIKSVLKRHDIVHRAGKNKKGETVDVSLEELNHLKDEVVLLAKNVIDSIE